MNQSSPESTLLHSTASPDECSYSPPQELPISPLNTPPRFSSPTFHSSPLESSESHSTSSHIHSSHGPTQSPMSESPGSSPQEFSGSQHLDSTPSHTQSSLGPSQSLLSESPSTLSHSSESGPNSSPELTSSSSSSFRQQSRPDPLSDPQIFAPLYPGAAITLCGALCAIMQFCTSNKLSFTAIGELLKLLTLLCPHPNLLPNSFYKFKKFFQQFHPIHHHHEICVQCQENTEDVCSCTDVNQENIAHLVHLEIHKPLEQILSGMLSVRILSIIVILCRHINCLPLSADNWSSLRTPLPSTGDNEILQDIWDGSALRPLCSNSRFFSNRDNLALSISTDGVPLYKSSPVSLWPVYLIILNLPAQIRMNAENVILCGIWIGRCKPVMSLLLKPITKHLQSLSTLGTVIKTSMGSATIRARLVMGVFDLPAKAAVLCCKQFNGKFGCSVCLNPGERLSNNARIYLPDKVFPQRTHALVVASATRAERTRSCVQGILSTSPFTSTLDLVNSIPIDYMHAVLEGVTRWLMKAWFDSRFHSEAYYIGRDVQRIDQHLLKLRPPCEFSRPPRSIKKHFKYWKASELRNWLLFYSLPLLLAYLPSLYWHHYALLVCAMHILLGDRIALAQVDAAHQMLVDFCVLLPELYGRQSCTANAHLLTHLAKFVRLWGPLWTHSAFGFESKNGRLKHLFHGNWKIIHQLLFNLNVSYTLQKVHTRLLECESEQTINYLHHISSNRNVTHSGTAQKGAC